MIIIGLELVSQKSLSIYLNRMFKRLINIILKLNYFSSLYFMIEFCKLIHEVMHKNFQFETVLCNKIHIIRCLIYSNKSKTFPV